MAEDLVSLQSQYSNALARNSDAKARLADCLRGGKDKNKQGQGGTPNRPSRPQQLSAHLENLRLQKQYNHLQTLSHNLDKAEHIADEKRLYALLDLARYDDVLRDTSGDVHSDDISRTQLQVDTLLDSARTLTTNLELALVKARQQLRREQALLERVKSDQRVCHDGVSEKHNSVSQLHALEPTRDGLQAWIADSLARCEQEVAVPGVEVPCLPCAAQSKEVMENIEGHVESEYQKYLQARQRLLCTTQALRTPLQPLASVKQLPGASTYLSHTNPDPLDGTAKQPVLAHRPPQHLRHKSRFSVTKFADHLPDTTLAEIEGTHLSDYHHEKLLGTWYAHQRHLTDQHDAQLLQVLNLLSHESHLLPAHPIPVTEAKDGDATILGDRQTVIGHLLKAWAYASENASDAVTRSVERHTGDSKNALAKAVTALAEMAAMEQMRKEVLG